MSTIYGLTTDGRVIDDIMVERLAAEAEQGFAGVEFVRPKTGRPWLGDHGPSASRSVRLPAALDAALIARARADRTTPSMVLREALTTHLAS